MKLGTYVIHQGDKIQILARQLLGDRQRTDELIQINQLRYPYISDNPSDQYAQPKGNVFLTSSITNPNEITIANPNQVVILRGDMVFFQQGKTHDAQTVQSVIGDDITLTEALNGTYNEATMVTVFSNQENISTQVLQTGDTLLYPFDSTVSGSNYLLLLGKDWKVDPEGFLTKEGRDIGIVKGLDNLSQGLRLRYQTPKGALLLHETYGNDVYSVLGESMEPQFKGLIKYYLEESGKQDGRVQDIQISSISYDDDFITAQISVLPIGSQDPINQSISIPIGGA